MAKPSITAFRMPYTDAAGRTSPESYWVLTTFSISPLDQKATIAFKGWNSIADYNADRAPILTRQYQLTPANWDADMALLQLDLSALVGPCYTLAKEIKDVGPAPEDGGEDTRVSFFENATQV